jgi:predicted trehalose synthase
VAVSPDAALSVGSVVIIALAGALWKLSAMIAEVRAEVRHNGGGSLKDNIHRIGAAVDQIKTSLADNATHLQTLDGRVTDHRRRNDAAVLALRVAVRLARAGDKRAQR